MLCGRMQYTPTIHILVQRPLLCFWSYAIRRYNALGLMPNHMLCGRMQYTPTIHILFQRPLLCFWSYAIAPTAHWDSMSLMPTVGDFLGIVLNILINSAVIILIANNMLIIIALPNRFTTCLL